MSFSYATSGTGPSAGGIGWFNFGALSLAPGQSQLGLTGTLNDGTKVTFDVAVSNVSGGNRTFTAGTVPTWGGAFFGNTNYTGVGGNVALKSNLTFLVSDNAITISNIVVVDPLNIPVANYTVLVGDAESSGTSESWTFNTNGSPWSLFTTIGTSTNPTLTGIGTQTATITGNDPTANQNEYILSTNNPNNLVLSTATSTTSGGEQAIVVGFAVTKVAIKKDIVGRLDPADQFKLDITGNYPATATTSGSANGLQPASAVSYGLPSTSFTINESMAAGSVNSLGAYTQTVTAVNLSPDQTVPVVGALPITLTPILGDNIIYTIKNSMAPPTITKVVDKTFAKLGDTITYSLQISNPNGGVLSNVMIQDPIPAGTSFVAGSITAINSTVAGTDPSVGITVNNIAANAVATVSWKVLVTSLPVPNPIPNTATMIEPTGTTVVSNQVTTFVNNATITTAKTVDAPFAQTGQVLTYTITLQNTGNVAANNVVITDPVPAGTTFVAGSVTGATGTPPALSVATIPANSSAVVTFKVLVGNSVPLPNPIPNTANVAFAYTADPAVPNGASGTSTSNTVTTFVTAAELKVVKATDKAYADVGEVVTYTIVVTNTGNTTATNVVITDPVPAGTTFINGTLIGANGAPPTLTLPNPLAAGGSVTIAYQVLIGNAIPSPNPVLNTANVAFNFTADPAVPNGGSGSAVSNQVQTLVNSAIISTVKSVDAAFANVGDIITYTITVNNTGNVAANNVVITDALPLGVSFIAGSLVGATGTPPTFTLTSPVAANGSSIISYKVLVNTLVPSKNPVQNSANAAFTYTTDPAFPNGEHGVSYSNVVDTQINNAKLVIKKSVDKPIAYLGSVVTYQIAVTNTGNAAASNVVITDIIPMGLTYVAGSVTVSAPFTGDPVSGITLTGPITAGQTVAISFKATVATMPNPNPAVNKATSAYSYVVDPQHGAIAAIAVSNAVSTTVFRHNYSQHISDLIASVALEQAALAAIANAEGAKIQRMAAMPNVTTQQLLCLNKSVADMTDSITMLEAVLRQKLSIVDCQINGKACM